MSLLAWLQLKPNQVNSQKSSLAKCQNPGHLRGIPVRYLLTEQVKCITPIVKIDANKNFQLTCNLNNTEIKGISPTFTNIQWIYE